MERKTYNLILGHIICIALITLGVFWFIGWATQRKIIISDTPIIKAQFPAFDTIYYDTLYIDNWQFFKRALIMTESEGDSLAVGATNDRGIFQITPVYVEEVNRILGDDRYTHRDAFLPHKSHEMFEIMQSHYNPQKCLKKALLLHNSGAMNVNYPTSYEHEVMRYYYQFKLEYIENRTPIIYKKYEN